MKSREKVRCIKRGIIEGRGRRRRKKKKQNFNCDYDIDKEEALLVVM
jgi:hypothetical protein